LHGIPAPQSQASARDARDFKPGTVMWRMTHLTLSQLQARELTGGVNSQIEAFGQNTRPKSSVFYLSSC
jgi:hypothetical protein